MRDECEHGMLRRKCDRCEEHAEIERLRMRLAEIDAELAAAMEPLPRPAEAALERMKCCDAPRPVIGCDCLRCMEANTRTAILAKHTAEAALVALRGEVREVLNPLEWRTSEFRLNSKSCPECFRYEEFGHLPDCRLAALLKRVAPAEARRDDSGLF